MLTRLVLFFSAALAVLPCGLAVAPCGLAAADASTANESTGRETQQKLDAAKQKLVESQEYELRYRMRPGDLIRWKVVHLATTETKISGNTQTSQSRSQSTKAWKVDQVSESGETTFVHRIDQVDMWQKVSGRQEVRYNSETDETPPLEYEGVAKTIGQPLATVVIDRNGQVLRREAESKSMAFGVGDIAVPLPAGRVRIGKQWQVPSEIVVRLPPDNRVQRIKTRQLYTLQKVETAVATISVKTEVLTPVEDPRIESQLMQQLTQGHIKFDLDSGRVLYKQLDWDDTVVGFNGADSSIKYLARFTEELVTEAPATAARPGTKKE